MSILQQIRDKAAWLVFGLIALSLVGFLLMDAFVGKSRFFGSNNTTVGVVNGEKLDFVKMQQEAAAQEDQYKAQGYPVNEATQQNIKDGLWKQFIEETVLTDVYNKVGLQVSDRELNDMLVGPNAIPQIRQRFTDSKTGLFDAVGAANRINQLRSIYKGNKKSSADYEAARNFFEQGLPQLIASRLREKYIALLTNSAYVPKWMAEKTIADNSQVASISYVDNPYTTIADSTVKVTDEEINDYVSKHKDQFKQEESRSFAYVSFSAAPTATDSANTLQQLQNLKAAYITTNDAPNFIANNGSDIGFFDSYVQKSKLQIPNKDSITSLSKGSVFGPYQDASNYVIAKKVAEISMPDSIKARHILVATTDPKTGQPVLEDSIAKKRIDSIKLLIDGGVKFDSLARKLSDDQGSKLQGGMLVTPQSQYFAAGQMVKEFNDFCIEGKPGEKKIVKTQFGYHSIEILDQKSFEPAYKIGYLAKKIDASPETDQSASGLANQFAGESRNQKSFDENAQKKNLQKIFATDVLPSDNSIRGLGTSRSLVRWLNDAEKGEVSEPFSVGDKYIVAVVTEINSEGTMNATKARAMVEPIIRNQKKAELIIKKIGNAASPESVAAATGQPLQKADSISFASPYIPNLGAEGKVVGAAFDQSLKGKPASPAITGNGGVFVIKVDNVFARINQNADLEQTRANLLAQDRSALSNNRLIDALTKTATIKDYRGKVY